MKSSLILVGLCLVSVVWITGCPLVISSTCEYEGDIYSLGESFTSTDDCNTCTCQVDGTVSCTDQACADVCVVDGETYELGEEFSAPDGCNTCVCTESGDTACTDMACDPTP